MRAHFQAHAQDCDEVEAGSSMSLSRHPFRAAVSALSADVTTRARPELPGGSLCTSLRAANGFVDGRAGYGGL
eukprot:9580753-Alexandrium_andersonii.AAC.1